MVTIQIINFILDEFLQNNYSLLTKSFETIAAIAGIIAWRKYRHTPVRYFIYFLIYVVILELIGTYPTFLFNINKFDLIEGTLIERNFWWYTLTWTIGSSLFYMFFYRKMLRTAAYKKLLKLLFFGFISVILIFYALDWTVLFDRRPFFVSVMNMFVVMLCTSLYFMEILSSERILNFPRSILFYISATILIWFLINTPLSFYMQYFRKVDSEFVLLRYKINLFSNIFMYLIFAFSLLWCKPQND